jgi:hypothetical protein
MTWRIPRDVVRQLREVGATDAAVEALEDWWVVNRPCMDGQDLVVPAGVAEIRLRSEPSA